MDGEMENTIERIKLQEQDKEAKLKEKRALEANLASLKRNLHDTTMATRKLKELFVETTARADAMEAEVNKAQAFYSSLCAQDEASKQKLQQLKSESEEGISKVWELRNKLCNEVHKVSDQCDVWALFTMPKYIEPISKPKKIPQDNTNLMNQKQNC